MRRSLVIAMLFCILALGAAGEGIGWFMDVGYVHYADGTTRLGGSVNSSLGCFVQLLWVGSNGQPDQAYNFGVGTWTTDDVVVDQRWIGAGAAGGANGWFAGGDIPAGGQIQEDRVYFARFWTDASADYGTGLVPTSLTNRYANGPTWTFPNNPGDRDDFDVSYAGNISTTLVPMAIPEPGVLALLALGFLGLRLTRKQR